MSDVPVVLHMSLVMADVKLNEARNERWMFF